MKKPTPAPVAPARPLTADHLRHVAGGEDTTVRDSQSGQASGKRTHHPITF